MYVLIDDLRDINKYVNADADEKLTIRTFAEGMNFVKHTNLKDITLLMDNDLDDPTPGNEGYDILYHAIDHGNYPIQVVLVTANPVARSRMSDLLLNNGYCYRGIGSRYIFSGDPKKDMRGF